MPPSIKNLMLNAKDSNYIKGMNTLDEAKVLQDGEAVEIINAIPDIPPRMRKGCVGKVPVCDGGSALLVASKPFYTTFVANGGGNVNNSLDVVLFWVHIGLDIYHLYYAYESLNFQTIPYTKYPVIRPVEYIGGGQVYVIGNYNNFDFVKVGDTVYGRAKIVLQSSGPDYRKMFALEYNYVNNEYKIQGRSIPTSNWNSGLKLDDTSFRIDDDATGKFSGDFAFGYSLTLVRRTDTGYSPITTTYAPGIIESPEVVASRYGVIRENAPNDDPVSIYIKPASLGGITANNQFGFTHARIYRTDNLIGSFQSNNTPETKMDNLNGATRKFLMDVSISAFYDNNNIIQKVKDTVSAAALKGELNQLSSYNYTFPPADGYRMLYFKDRLFLIGENGAVFFSAVPGEDGGSDLEYAQLHKAKYALWFSPLFFRIDLDVEERTASTGMGTLGDDLFLFKENKVYMVIGGDPLTPNAFRTINDKTGCPFPDTITRAILFGQEVLFFMSNAGPMYITAGGNSRQFTEFKIKEFWPDTGSDLFKGWYEAINRPNGVSNCTAAFWNNAIWVFLQFGGNEAQIFGYVSTDETNGAFEVRLADKDGVGFEFPKYRINNIVITNDNRALTVGNNYDNDNLKCVFVDFLGNEESYDTFQDGQGTIPVRARPNFILLSRKIYPGPLERSISELFRVTAYNEFTVDRLEDKPFTLEIHSNRYRTMWDYHDPRGRSWFQSNQLGKPVAVITNKDMVVRQDGGAWTPHTLQGYAIYLYNEAAPHNGIWRKVKDNGTDGLTVNFAVGAYHTHIRLIAVPRVRLNIDFVPQADFVGEFFQYKLTKVIPSDRNFDWYGVEIQAVQRPQLDIESIAGGLPSDSTMNFNAWE